MKTLITLLLAVCTSSIFAQTSDSGMSLGSLFSTQQKKTPVVTTSQGVVAGSKIQPLDSNKLFEAQEEPAIAGSQVTLTPGVYKIYNDKWGWTYEWSLILEGDAKEQGVHTALLLPSSLDAVNGGRGYILKAKPMQGGAEYLFTPLVIDFTTGLVIDVAEESNENVPYFILSNDPGRKNRYVIHPDSKFPGLFNQIMYVKEKSNSSVPAFANPAQGIYQVGWQDRGIVSGNLFVDGSARYQMLPILGRNSSILALQEARVDVMARSTIGGHGISGLIAYIKDCWSDNAFVHFMYDSGYSYRLVYYENDEYDFENDPNYTHPGDKL